MGKHLVMHLMFLAEIEIAKINKIIFFKGQNQYLIRTSLKIHFE